MSYPLQHIHTPWGHFSFQPANALEQRIILDPEWQAGLFFGKPRRGHPEGQIWPHILEVMENVEMLQGQVAEESIERLRLITLIHDSFKYKVNEHKSHLKQNHHAYIARVFAEKYIEDSALLDIIELHDEAYYAWRMGGWYQDWLSARYRLHQLLERLGNSLQEYYLFFKCDTQTGDKDQSPLIWFEEELHSQITTVDLEKQWQ